MSGQLVAELAARVLLPLIAGGEIRPLPPIGAARALAVAESGVFATAALDEARARRLRVARRLCPVDAMPDPSAAEWLLLCAFNDLLQSTNPTLVGPLGGGRPRQLLEMALSTVLRAGPPATLGEALGRHATFSRLLEVVRIDTHVSFWVGRRVFRGARPPRRLTRWRTLRRVTELEQTVRLTEMAPASPEATPLFEEVLAALIAASPLTDLATAARDRPAFRWSGAALSLVAVPGGRRLALRALGRVRARHAVLGALRELPGPVRLGTTAEAARAAGVVAEMLAELERRGREDASATQRAEGSATPARAEPQ